MYVFLHVYIYAAHFYLLIIPYRTWWSQAGAQTKPSTLVLFYLTICGKGRPTANASVHSHFIDGDSAVVKRAPQGASSTSFGGNKEKSRQKNLDSAGKERELLGYVTMGGYSYRRGRGVAFALLRADFVAEAMRAGTLFVRVCFWVDCVCFGWGYVERCYICALALFKWILYAAWGCADRHSISVCVCVFVCVYVSFL